MAFEQVNRPKDRLLTDLPQKNTKPKMNLVNHFFKRINKRFYLWKIGFDVLIVRSQLENCFKRTSEEMAYKIEKCLKF